MRAALHYYEFCEAMCIPDTFNEQGITAFMQHYLFTGRAHTSLPGFISAWREYADDAGVMFPGAASAAMRRISKFIRGAQLRFPHTPRRSVPLILARLLAVAAHLGIRRGADLERVSTAVLSFYTRLVVAQQACLRPCEHDAVLTVGDVSVHRGHIRLRVGVLPAARKIKRRPPRTALLAFGAGRFGFLAAGTALRVLLRRLHRRCPPQASLFPRFAGGIPLPRHQPWRLDLRRLRAVVAVVLPSVDITRIDGRSLRSGGATDLFAVGATATWVQRQGGWRSDAVQIYNRPGAASRGAALEAGFLRAGFRFQRTAAPQRRRRQRRRRH